jgi:exosortase/archaeosortase family protein
MRTLASDRRAILDQGQYFTDRSGKLLRERFSMINAIRLRTLSNIQLIGHGVLFVFVVVGLSLAINTYLPVSSKEVLRQITGRMAALILLPFSETTFDGLLLVTNGFGVKIAVECTALNFLTIFTAGVIAYPQHTVKYKIIGIIAGTTTLTIMNSMRIAVLGLVGTYAPEAFDFLHIYIWQGLFALLVVIVWIVWVQKLIVDRPLMMKTGIALLVSLISFSVLSAIMPAYLEALAVVARLLSRLLFDGALCTMTVSGDMVALNCGTIMASTRTVAINAYSQLVFVALMATSFKWEGGMEIVKRTAYGLGVYFLLLLAHVMLLIAAITHGVPAARMEVLDVSVRTFALSLCISLYVIHERKMRIYRNNKSAEIEGGTINEEIFIAQ